MNLIALVVAVLALLVSYRAWASSTRDAPPPSSTHEDPDMIAPEVAEVISGIEALVARAVAAEAALAPAQAAAAKAEADLAQALADHAEEVAALKAALAPPAVADVPADVPADAPEPA